MWRRLTAEFDTLRIVFYNASIFLFHFIGCFVYLCDFHPEQSQVSLREMPLLLNIFSMPIIFFLRPEDFDINVYAIHIEIYAR